MVHPLWKTVWQLLKKLNIELLYDPEIPLLGVYIQKKKAQVPKNTHTPKFITTIIKNNKKWKKNKNL